jgi:hypothetical protein
LNKLILVDADGLLYLAGAMGEKREYEVIFYVGDVPYIKYFDSVSDYKEFFKENPEARFSERELVVTPGPLENCLQIAKGKLKDIQNRYKGDLEVYVKGDGTNFRNDLATIAGYKANRTALKPYYLEELRQYLINTWNAIEISGKEADDAIATRAYEASKPYVICSPDKDLDQIPGLHWNYAKNVEYDIHPDEARAFFWRQVLEGDSADNIKGCHKIGRVTAEKLVAGWLDDQLTDVEIWDQILCQYCWSTDKNACPYDNAIDAAIENARLVWMQTENLRLWTPPGEPTEYMQGDLDD